METVLITGGTGMIDKALIDPLFEIGFNALLVNYDLINKFENG